MITMGLIAFVAFLHFYFMSLEMFFWTKPAGLKAFRMTLAQAEATHTLAKNQGLYNGFLATGLMWSALAADPLLAFQLRLFFLSCVITAGLYGAATVSKKILYIQALPAAFTLTCVFLGK